MKLFIDTNIWIRHIVRDTEQSQSCSDLIKAIENGQHRVYTSNIVLFECVYVLEKLYKVKNTEVQNIIEAIMSVRALTLIERTNTPLALEWYKKYQIKFADCQIATQIPVGATLVSFDTDFDAISGIDRKEPQKIIATS